MKIFQFAAMVLIGLVLFGGSASAQKKKTTKKPAPAKPPVATVPPLDVRAGREKVGIQLSNVNEFVNKLGTIAQGLEVADADMKAGNLKPATAEKIKAKKTEIVEAIRNIKVGLGNLESEFRTKAALKKYLPAIQGITDLAAQAEDTALAGRFVAAKEPLRGVAKKLTDTQTTMPL